MLYEDLTKKIIGCAMEVHKRLGNACLPAKAGISGSNLSTSPGNRNEFRRTCI